MDKVRVLLSGISLLHAVQGVHDGESSMRERQIHDAFEVWLRERKIPFVHHRMDRRSGIAKGWPDYSVFWMGRAVMIEVKTIKGRLSPDQLKVIEFIRRSGNTVEIARNVPECVEAVQNILCEGKPNVGHYGGCNYPLEGCFKELKQTVAKVPGNGSGERDQAGNCFIANFQGKDSVFRRDPIGATFLHVADSHDLQTLPRGNQYP